jgi:hypothetical protein
MTTGYLVKQANAAKRYVPIVRVSFHTEDACYQLKGEQFDSITDFRSALAIDPTMTVTTVTTTKSLDTPAGAFTIQLVGAEWIDKIKANDLVVIQMGYKKKASDPKDMPSLSTVMVGLVDTRRRVRSSGANTVMTTITGRDFGKILLKENVKFYPALGQVNPDASPQAGEKFFLTQEGWLTLLRYFSNENMIKGTPATVLDVIMRFIMPKLNAVEWTVWDESKSNAVPKKVDVTNVLRYNFAEVDLFVLPTFLAADSYEGSVWNLMERASAKPFTELFVDVRESSEAWNPGDKPRVVNETIEQASDDSKTSFPKGNGFYPTPRMGFGEDNSAVMVALRNTPFDKSMWEKLYTHDLQAEDVIDEDLSLSDNEHYNLFWAGTTINPLGIDLKLVAPPLWNEDQVKRYGLSPLEVQIEGLSLDPSDPTQSLALEGLSKSFTAKLKAWFENNHNYLSGTMNVRGVGSYKIGHRLLRKGIGKEFYIEGVSQTFTMFETWTTSLQLTRGMDLGSAPNHKMYLPNAVNSAPDKPASQKSDAEITAESYTVKSGDSLYSIAAKPGVYGDGNQWSKLLDANKEQLIARDSRNTATPGKYIYAGQVLRIPR